MRITYWEALGKPYCGFKLTFATEFLNRILIK